MKQLFHCGRCFGAVLLFVFGASSEALGQPDIWGVQPGLAGQVGGGLPGVFVFDANSGAEQKRFVAPPGVRVCTGTMTADRRWYLVPTSVGVARFDVVGRRLADVLPLAAPQCGPLTVSPGGRWWHRTIWGAAGAPWATEIVDAVTRQVIHRDDVSSVSKVVFDAADRRYELRPGEVRAWPSPASGTPLWTHVLPGVRDLEVASTGLYALFETFTEDALTAEVVRYDSTSGIELARGQLSVTDGFHPRIADLKLVDGRVFLVGGDAQSAVVLPVRRGQFVATLDALSLASGSSAFDLDAAGQNDELLLDATGGGTLKRVLLSGRLSFVQLYSLDLTTLAASNFRSLDSGPLEGVALADVVRPPAPRLRATIGTDRRLTLTWEPDTAGPAPNAFHVRGALRGEALAVVASLADEARTWTSPSLPPGTYALEVVGSNAVGSGAASNRIEVSIDDRGIPGAPQALTASGGDDIWQLRWTPPATDPVPGGYLVEAAPGGSNIFSTVTRATFSELHVSAVPVGAWQARVRAVTAGGVGAPSNTVTFSSTRCTTAPGVPNQFAALTTGNVVTLQWLPPTGGAAEYVIEAGNAPGVANLARFTTASPSPSFQTSVPAGGYFVRVRARNACGESGASNEALVFVP